MMRRGLRAVYYRLPHSRLPWAWRLVIAAWLLDLAKHNDGIFWEAKDMGGTPKTHTPYDRRLSENKERPPHQTPPKPAGTPVKPAPVKPGK